VERDDQEPDPGHRHAARSRDGLHQRGAIRAAARNAVLLTLNGYGHVSNHDPSACIDQARVAYLVDLTTPPNGSVCQPEKQPFDPGFGKLGLRRSGNL
jgi:hypothetical protein